MKKTINDLFHTLSKWEKYFFYLMILIHLFPLLLFSVFPTVDGPAHLYNSGILSEMATNGDSPYFEYYTLNSLLIPNWSGHFILSFLLLIFPPLVAEKLLLIGIIAGLPLSFRYLFRQLHLKEKYLLYFIFPFTYSFLLYYGFYNFFIGIIFFFCASSYWLKHYEKGFKMKHLLVLLFLSFGTYFSHLFVFAILIGFIGFMGIYSALFSTRKLPFKTIALPFIVFLPGLAMAIVYLGSNPISGGGATYLDASELWSYIIDAQPAKAITYGKEGTFTKWVFYLMIIISIGRLAQWMLRSKRNVSPTTVQLGILSGLMLVFLFLVPDSTTHSVGFVSSRITLFFFFFAFLFLATGKLNIWLKFAVFVLINYVNIALVKIYVEETETQQNRVAGIIEAGKQIDKYSTVFPVNDSDLWILGNSSNYLSAENPMIILENYEAALHHFPLSWDTDKLPKFHFGDPGFWHERIPPGNKKESRQIDYVLLIKEKDAPEAGAGEKGIRHLLDDHYHRTYTSSDMNVVLYQKN